MTSTNSTSNPHNVSGTLAPGFEAVREAFLSIFQDGLELGGAGFCAYCKPGALLSSQGALPSLRSGRSRKIDMGEKVVDLVGGWSDIMHSVPFTKDKVHVVHSCGKALMSMSVCHAISEGKLKWEQKVGDLWPEFAQGGKGDVSVKDLLEHMGGVAWLDPPYQPTLSELQDLDALARRIAPQPHNYGGVTTKCYHAVTRGWYLNELLRRTMHTTQGDLMRTWGEKLGVSVFVGLPESAESRVVDLFWSPLCKEMIAISKRAPQLPHYKSLIGTRIADVAAPEENVLQRHEMSFRWNPAILD
ncbi:hypothetical protein HDU93_007085 [Gonapodya sp. JEL0774]|nr:hypothetical protein HDU93_007085 [Gonapodya sp. JEL0774]